MKEIKQQTKSPWKKAFFVVGIIFLITAVFMITGKQNPLNPQPDSSIDYSKSICSQIKGTPAWMQNGEIIGYGYGFPENYALQSFNDVVNDYLIPNKITMVWDEKCIHCQRQIESFGDSWQDYQESELTIECHNLK